METVSDQTKTKESSSPEQKPVDTSSPNGKAESSECREESQVQGTNNDQLGNHNGKKGFKFGRLKEEVSFQGNAVELQDSSVIIANPAYQEDNHKVKKKAKVRKQAQADKLSLSSHDQKFTQGGGIINKMYQEEADTPQPKDEDEEKNQEVLDNTTTDDSCQVETDDR